MNITEDDIIDLGKWWDFADKVQVNRNRLSHFLLCEKNPEVGRCDMWPIYAELVAMKCRRPEPTADSPGGSPMRGC